MSIPSSTIRLIRRCRILKGSSIWNPSLCSRCTYATLSASQQTPEPSIAATTVQDETPATFTSTTSESEQSKTSRRRALTQKERDFLASCLRVNQAGELGANLIYAGQYAILKHDPRMKPLIRHMWDQEIHHLSTFNTLLAHHRVRPTALRPLWNVAGYALGLGTALMGEKAAMACTEAVETEIGGHYNDQLRVLLKMLKDGDGNDGKGLTLDKESELGKLVDTIRQFRDDELEHLDTAVEYDAKGAQGYEILTNVIRGGCKAAIWLSKRF